MIQATTEALAKRNPDILSAAVRSAGGKLLVEAGDHQVHWGEGATQHSTATHMHVPISLGDKRWGTVELRFRPLARTSIFAPLGNPVLRHIAFVAIVGFLAYLIYLRRTLRQRTNGPA